MRIFLLALLLTNFSFAQISYEKGYYIDNNGTKIKGYIKNEDWKNNPKKFQFKISTNSENQTKEINAIQEFGVDSVTKYKRFKIQIDKSSTKINDLSEQRNPEFIEETVFLKVLIEGKNSLYFYQNAGLKKFYFSTNQSLPEPLIYKKYKSDVNSIVENKTFIYQLKEKLKCNEINENDFFKLKYIRKDLIELFEKNSVCSDEVTISYEKRNSRKSFELKIRPGIHSSQITVTDDSFNDQISTFNYDRELNFRIGIEGEVFLPFNKNKWSLFGEPTFQTYSSQKTFDNRENKITYQTIQIALGGRHYFFLNNKSKVFIDLALNISYRMSDNEIVISNLFTNSLRSDTYAISAGLGYQYEKLHLQIRHLFRHRIAESLNFDIIGYSSTSLILGYTLF